MVVHRQPESSRVMTFFPSAANSLPMRLTRWISVPTAKLVPDGASRIIFSRPSVEPMPSAFWQTSQRHSGCTITRMPGILRANVVDVLGQEALMDRAVAFPQNYFGVLQAARESGRR